MYIQCVNRIRRCSPHHLSLASSHGKVAPVDARSYLLHARKGVALLGFSFLQDHQKVIFGPLGTSQKNKMSCNIPFSTQGKIIPKLFGSIWFVSSLAKTLHPKKISFATCGKQQRERKAAGAVLLGMRGRTAESRMEYPSSSHLGSVARHPA